MKRETYQNKLAELLGLDQFKIDPKKGKSSKNTSDIVGITEDEIQSFRAAQGLVYFLQAPALFTPKTCPHCGESFLVSRQYVAFCSYTCIKKDLEAKGLSWSKGQDIEALIKDVYDGNEPLWIRNLDSLRTALEQAASQVSLLSQASTSNQESSLMLETTS